QVLTNEAMGDETRLFTLAAPATLSAGESFARFRLSTQGGLGPGGEAVDGEVEDYHVTLFVNIAPVANSDAYTVSEGGTLAATDANGATTPGNPNDNGVLANDIDADGNTLSVTLVSPPSHASN